MGGKNILRDVHRVPGIVGSPRQVFLQPLREAGPDPLPPGQKGGAGSGVSSLNKLGMRISFTGVLGHTRLVSFPSRVFSL